MLHTSMLCAINLKAKMFDHSGASHRGGFGGGTEQKNYLPPVDIPPPLALLLGSLPLPHPLSTYKYVISSYITEKPL